MMRKIKRWRRFPAVERSFLLRAWAWLLLFDLGLRTLPFPIVRRMAARVSQRGGPAPIKPRRMAELVAAAGRNHWIPMTCLRRALALQRLLGSHGIAAELRFGARRREEGIDAHAWLDVDGEALEASPESVRFPPLRKLS